MITNEEQIRIKSEIFTAFLVLLKQNAYLCRRHKSIDDDNSSKPYLRHRVQIPDGRRAHRPHHPVGSAEEGRCGGGGTRNEYANNGRDNCRCSASTSEPPSARPTVREHLMLIELQKTWLETETLRFRQYLGAQYDNVENMQPDNQGAYAIPMVAVYLLGHKVGDIEEPVLYVRRNSYDYNDREVTKGLPNPFVDSLTHDSIIVQIPLLHGQINNRLDKVLSIFDQSRKDQGNKQMLDIDETAYANDDEMLRIIHRLQAAASDAKMRHDMNVEDEYFSVIEKRDTTIMLKDKEIAEKNVKLEEQGAKLEEQSVRIEEQSVRIEEQSVRIEEQSERIEEQSVRIEEQKMQIEQKDAQIRTSVQMLHKAGMTPENIAVSLNMDIDSVREIIFE